MLAHWLPFCAGFCISSITWQLCAGQDSLELITYFIFYNSSNVETYRSNSRYDDLSAAKTGCDPNDRYAMIVHGLGENCSVQWAVNLRSNLTSHRGGCIICMDYGAYSQSYPNLLILFNKIAEIFTAKLIALKKYNFSPFTAFLFGFSVGARIVVKGAIDFGKYQIGRIDACEPAGPGFDNTTTVDPQQAALEVQCIHTDADLLGTYKRNCDQDWLMGDCGKTQVGAQPFPNGDHGLCTQFYNSAFDNAFLAVSKSETCNEPPDSRDATRWPIGFRMGYYQETNGDPNLYGKSFYAKTTKNYPFNA